VGGRKSRRLGIILVYGNLSSLVSREARGVA
jgi:hypothetical protein